ncbi:MAG: ATP-binding protein, partial [Ignavibacteriales bacterium]|nr:ATP-binding protein [Ignavibacteriales bacterium]
QQEINAITDRTLFDEILENLISNAIKYSPICKEIKVKITILPDKVSLIVKDSGPGFSEDDKQKIFKPFTKLSAVPTAGEASSGLGLSIVKNYVEILNADLILRSKLGEGSEFELIIPLEIPDPTS